MKLKTAVKKHEFLISTIGIGVTAYMFVIGLFGTFLSDYSPGVFTSFNEMIGAWRWWFLVLGVFGMFIFTLVIIFRYKNLKEFQELYETESKSKFRKNIARVETLALKLGPEYEEKVIEKEEEFNINR